MVKYDLTVRQISEITGISKSTVHKDVSEVLPSVDSSLGEDAKKHLRRHKHLFSTVSPFRLFILEAEIKGEKRLVYAIAEDPDRVLKESESRGAEIIGNIAEFPDCDDMCMCVSASGELITDESDRGKGFSEFLLGYKFFGVNNHEKHELWKLTPIVKTEGGE